MIKEEHLKDIDFRSHDERSKAALDDFKSWYIELTEYVAQHDYNERLSGQLTMLSSVLWYLLPPTEYKKLTKHKP